MTPPERTLVEIVRDDFSLGIAPWIGGSVAWLRWRGVDVLRSATPEALAADDPLGMGSFPLAPFAGRIPGGRFRFEDREIVLPPNLGGEPAAIHGQGWRLPWQVADRGAAAVSLRLDHPVGPWPWRYQADQTLTLTARGLAHRLSVTNRDTRPMPAGLGFHPYFPRDGETFLTALVDGVFLGESDQLSPPPTGWDWGRDARVDAPVDHQFGGWDSHAIARWPARDLALDLLCDPPTPYLVVYAPAGEAYFCAEPVGHRLDAVNRSPGGAAHGMRVLAPGEVLTMTMQFRPRHIAP